MNSFWWKGPLIVVFAVNASLTVNPMRIDVVDELNTYLTWIKSADWTRKQPVYINKTGFHNKFRVVLPGSGDLSILYHFGGCGVLEDNAAA